MGEYECHVCSRFQLFVPDQVCASGRATARCVQCDRDVHTCCLVHGTSHCLSCGIDDGTACKCCGEVLALNHRCCFGCGAMCCGSCFKSVTNLCLSLIHI